MTQQISPPSLRRQNRRVILVLGLVLVVLFIAALSVMITR